MIRPLRRYEPRFAALPDDGHGSLGHDDHAKRMRKGAVEGCCCHGGDGGYLLANATQIEPQETRAKLGAKRVPDLDRNGRGAPSTSTPLIAKTEVLRATK